MNTKKELLFSFGEVPVRMDLKPERIQEMLARLPGWELHSSGAAIVRKRTFTTEERATAFARRACWLASKLTQPLMVRLAGTQVAVALTGHPVRGCVGGLTSAVFTLADLIG